MKIKSVLASIMIASLLLAGCSDKNEQRNISQSGSTTVSDVLEQNISSEEDKSSEEVISNEQTVDTSVDDTSSDVSEISDIEPIESSIPDEPDKVYDDSEIEIDLTSLSSTMVYSEVYNMMNTPDDYIGKVVKMSGIYSYYKDEYTGNEYNACIIQDATACCSQGIEFITNDECPELNDEVTVVGVFDIYFEDGFMYATLRNSRII